MAPPLPIAPTAPVKVKSLRVVPVTQGAGAMALMAPAVVPAPRVAVYYLTATARFSTGQESGYSNEVKYTNALRLATVELAWDSYATNVWQYTIYKGRASRSYTNSYSAGTNLTLRVPLFPPVLTNVVITVSCLSDGTNIAYASKPTGSWTMLNTTNWTATNPPAPRYFRSLGVKGNAVTISVQRF